MLQKVFYWGLPLKNLNTCSPKIFNVERNVGGSAQKEACYVLEKLCIYPLLSTVNTYLWIFRVHYRRLILFTVMTYLWCGKYLTFVYLALLSLCPVKFLAFLFNTRKKLASFCLSSHVCHTKHSRGTGGFPKIMFPLLIPHLDFLVFLVYQAKQRQGDQNPVAQNPFILKILGRVYKTPMTPMKPPPARNFCESAPPFCDLAAG